MTKNGEIKYSNKKDDKSVIANNKIKSSSKKIDEPDAKIIKKSSIKKLDDYSNKKDDKSAIANNKPKSSSKKLDEPAKANNKVKSRSKKLEIDEEADIKIIKKSNIKKLDKDVDKKAHTKTVGKSSINKIDKQADKEANTKIIKKSGIKQLDIETHARKVGKSSIKNIDKEADTETHANNKSEMTFIDMMMSKSLAKSKVTRSNNSGSKSSVKSRKNTTTTMNLNVSQPKESLVPKIMPVGNEYINKMANSLSTTDNFLRDHDIKISTITLDCKLRTLVNVDKFAKNIDLREDGVVSVKFGDRNNLATNRTIVVVKSKKKPSTKSFYNQVTILMKPMNNPSRNYINIKVFKNGSLQMTGCKDLNDFHNVTNTLISILKAGKKINNKRIKFIEDADNIGIHDVNIRMINSNFKLDYKIDRKKLKELLKKNHGCYTKDTDIGYVEYKYKPNGGHSCVNIKHKPDEHNKTSIFVFQTGAVIITGAKKINHIIMAYQFIQKILTRYYDEIKIVDLDQKAVQLELAKFYRNRINVPELTTHVSTII